MIEILEAIALIEARVQPSNKTRQVALFEALGKITAKDILCKRDLPPFDNSAMDGYGIKLSNCGQELLFNSTIFAGDDITDINDVPVKIMTGAPVPHFIDAVVPFEDAKILDNKAVLLPSGVKQGANIRKKGEELKTNDILIKAGQKLTPAHIGLLASQGIMLVDVISAPKVGIISSGKEIIEPWEDIKEYQIYNSNAALLHAYTTMLGCDAEYIKVVNDNFEDAKNFFGGLANYDLLITSGGISMGEADFTLNALEAVGFKTVFQKINIKPGKPTTFGFLNSQAFLALPGNPLSAAVNFYLLGTIIISRLCAQINYYPQILKVKNKKEFTIKNARANVVLGTIQDGEFLAYNDAKYGSGMITPLANSNAFIILNSGKAVAKDEWLNVVLLDEIGATSLKDLISNV